MATLLCTVGTLRAFLFHGDLPPTLLPTARLLCATAGTELTRALADARGDGGISGEAEEEAAFDWSRVDWSAEVRRCPPLLKNVQRMACVPT